MPILSTTTSVTMSTTTPSTTSRPTASLLRLRPVPVVYITSCWTTGRAFGHCPRSATRRYRHISWEHAADHEKFDILTAYLTHSGCGCTELVSHLLTAVPAISSTSPRRHHQLQHRRLHALQVDVNDMHARFGILADSMLAGSADIGFYHNSVYDASCKLDS